MREAEEFQDDLTVAKGENSHFVLSKDKNTGCLEVALLPEMRGI